MSGAGADDVTRTWHGQTLALVGRHATALAPARHGVALSYQSMFTNSSSDLRMCDSILPVPPSSLGTPASHLSLLLGLARLCDHSDIASGLIPTTSLKKKNMREGIIGTHIYCE